MPTKNGKKSKKRAKILKKPSRNTKQQFHDKTQQKLKHNIRESFIRLERIDHQLVQFQPFSVFIKQEYDENAESHEIQQLQNQDDTKEELIKLERIDAEVEYQSVDVFLPTNAILNEYIDNDENYEYIGIERNDGNAETKIELVSDEMVDIIKNEMSTEVDEVTLNAFRNEMAQISHETSGSSEQKHTDIIESEKRKKKKTMKIKMSKRKIKCPKRVKLKPLKIRGFPCSFCEKAFSRKYELIDHIKSKHPKETIYECTSCRYRSADAVELSEHELKCVNRRTFECVFCKYKQNNLCNTRRHIRMHLSRDKVVKCNICGKGFWHTNHLASHVRTVHPKMLPFECKKCKKSFVLAGRFKTHNKICSGIWKKKCSLCSQTFVNADVFEEHQKECGERRYDCYLCKFTKPPGCKFQLLRNHFKRSHIERRISSKSKCPDCKKRFAFPHCVTQHISQHHPQYIPLICLICDRRFATRTERIEHQTQCNKPRIQCYLCRSTFKGVSRLQNHMVLLHTSERKHKCEICSKSFTLEVHLKNHLKVHGGGDAFKCDYCPRVFPLSSHKTNHERFCVRTFICYLCKEEFSSFEQLRDKHLKTHLPGIKSYKCQYCPSSHENFKLLKKHISKKHTHLFGFQCNICQGIFKDNKCIQKHQKTCVKPIRKSKGVIHFKCSLCGWGLLRVAELRKHMISGECPKYKDKLNLNKNYNREY